ncbi:YlxR family protein [bacterium]|nr:YlxR family protein [bacterium]
MKQIQRKCQACGEIYERNSLIKITKLNDILKINPTSKEIGRSMYVCPNIECVKMLIKKKRIKTSLKFNNQEEIKRIEDELLKMVS